MSEPSAAADRLEVVARGRLRRAARHELAACQRRLDMAALTAALVARDAGAALAVVRLALAPGLASLSGEWAVAALAAARQEAHDTTLDVVKAAVPPGVLRLPIAKAISFDAFRGTAAALIASVAARVRQGFEATVLKAAFLIISRVVGSGVAAEQGAALVRAALPLNESQAGALWSYWRALATLDRAALRSALRDRRSDGTVEQAILTATSLPPGVMERLVAGNAARALDDRIVTIGATEALRSRWHGTYAMWRQQTEDGAVAGVTKKWAHRGDHKVRETHLSIPRLQPDPIPLDAYFETSAGNRLLHPGDPSAPASEVINCRCYLTFQTQPQAS